MIPARSSEPQLQGRHCSRTPLNVRRRLDRCLVARKRSRGHHIQREGDVHETHRDHDRVAKDLDLLDMSLRDTKRRGHLLPAKACVGHEDAHGEDVEHGPERVLEDLELERVDVPHTNRLDVGLISPEEVERGDAPEVDEVGRRADEVGPELVSVTEAELEEVDRHEGEEHKARDGEIQHANALALCQCELHVPGPLEANEDVQQNGQENVLLHDIGREAEAGPVEAHVEVAIAVEVIGALEDVEVADRVDNDEEDEKDGAARQAKTVVGDLDVLRREDSSADLVEHGGDESPGGVEVGLHVDEEHAGIVSEALDAPVLGTIEVAPSLVVGDEIALVLLHRRRALGTLSLLRLRGLGCTNRPDDSIRRVLADHVRRVNHVEFRSGILASECEDGQLAARV
mmetsp:Transcript_89046/g.197836  ORF Transcript_89046/g.197836 Transcript_89046/m.197836 type:complete len:400 (+) Transcript_89046:23-1222(+)